MLRSGLIQKQKEFENSAAVVTEIAIAETKQSDPRPIYVTRLFFKKSKQIAQDAIADTFIAEPSKSPT